MLKFCHIGSPNNLITKQKDFLKMYLAFGHGSGTFEISTADLVALVDTYLTSQG